jgi:hypothetical protein
VHPKKVYNPTTAPLVIRRNKLTSSKSVNPTDLPLDLKNAASKISHFYPDAESDSSFNLAEELQE